MRSKVASRLVAILAIVALTIVPSIAAASEQEQETPEAEDSSGFGAVVDAMYDEMFQVLIFAINSAGDVPADCGIPDDVALSGDDDGNPGDSTVTLDVGERDVPAGCTVVDVQGPNGQVNHGQVVSSFVHALKALDRSAIDVPFGQLVRQIAGSDFGKTDMRDDDPVGDGDEGSDEIDDEDDVKGPPPHANNDKVKEPKSNSGNNGNGRGPNN